MTRGVDEPYRLFTSRAEFRLLLRQDNCLQRLGPIAEELGLLDEVERRALGEHMDELTMVRDWAGSVRVEPDQVESYLESVSSAPLKQKGPLTRLLLRPEVRLGGLLGPAGPFSGADFDADAVAQAQSRRAVLLQDGFARTRELSAEIERASFFRLVDIYRECRASAEDIQAVFAGSEIDARAAELIAGIDSDLAELEAQLDQHEVGRLRAILAGLKAQESEVLAAEVEGYLSEKYGGMD